MMQCAARLQSQALHTIVCRMCFYNDPFNGGGGGSYDHLYGGVDWQG